MENYMIDDKKMYRQFYAQRWNAENKRNIEWKLSFDEWKQLWLESGRYDQRGIYQGQYQMCRYNDKGPYSIDNVRIDTTESNLTERKGKVENGRYERWQKEGERENQSKRMKEFFKNNPDISTKLKEYQSSELGKENRKKIIASIRKSRVKPIIGTNIKTGETIELYGATDIHNKGFTSSCVNKCANGKLLSHKGYTFEFK